MRCGVEWTEERKATLTRLWNSGQPSSQVAEFFGSTVRAVLRQVDEMRSRGTNLQVRRNPKFDPSLSEQWTQEDREEVFRRRALGATPESIAHYVARSPFAVTALLQRGKAV